MPAHAGILGKEAEFRYHKFIEEDDTPYSDQWVLTAEDQQFGDCWLAECDLEILQPDPSTRPGIKAAR